MALTCGYLSLRGRPESLKFLEGLFGSLLMLARASDVGEDIRKLTFLRSVCFLLLSCIRFPNSEASICAVILPVQFRNLHGLKGSLW
jgi:hypothetical protein